MTSAPADGQEGMDKPEVFPAKFGRIFEKAASVTKLKTSDVCTTDSDVFLNKFQSGFRSKGSVLPGNLSSLVSKHRETMKLDEDIIDEADDEVVQADFERIGKGNTDQKDTDDVSDHSWDMPVAKLIVDDEVKHRKSHVNAKNKSKKVVDLENSVRESSAIGKKGTSGRDVKDGLGKEGKESKVSSDNSESCNRVKDNKSDTGSLEKHVKSGSVYDELMDEVDDVGDDDASLTEIKKSAKRTIAKGKVTRSRQDYTLNDFDSSKDKEPVGDGDDRKVKECSSAKEKRKTAVRSRKRKVGDIKEEGESEFGEDLEGEDNKVTTKRKQTDEPASKRRKTTSAGNAEVGLARVVLLELPIPTLENHLIKKRYE